MKKIKRNTKLAIFLGSISLISLFLFSKPFVSVSQAETISGISINSYDSQQLPKYPVAATIDGNSATFWASQYYPTLKSHPHYIALDLGNSYNVEGFNYLPRQDGGTYGLNGTITKYEIYVSEDTQNWGAAVKSGTLAADSTLKKITFTAKQGRYIKFVSLADAKNTGIMVVAELSIVGTVIDSSEISTPVTSSNVSINSYDSQQLPKYPVAATIDGNSATFWASQYYPTLKSHPHYIALDLGNSYNVEGFNYLPRQDGGTYGLNGTITKYEIYVSEDTQNWGAAVKSGTLAADSTLKKITFTAKQGRYIKFVSLADAKNTGIMVVAEIQAIGDGIPNKEILYPDIMGPEISVGLWVNTKDSLNANPLKVEANKKYNIKNSAGNIIASVENNIITRVSYVSDKNFKVYNSIPEKLSNREVSFEAADGNSSNMVFDIHRPNSSYDRYRGKIKIRYTDSNNIWVINTLPMEQYVWGDGELAGTGPMEHSKTMTTIFRTYGYWYLNYATKYLPYGFRIKSDSGNQIYSGYDHETNYPNVKIAAQNTKGKIATYGSEIALTPYSSWSDGRTRSFEERWGSDDYPWCKSVKDPYGKNSTMTTAQLETAGNHMVGLIANGSLKLAGSSYNWDYQKIMKYYYTGINLTAKY